MTSSAAKKNRAAITGGFGQFGWHLRCQLFGRQDFDAVPLGRDEMADRDVLTEKLAGADMVVHLAAVNRGSDDEVAAVNPELAERVVAALDRLGAKPHVIYASSTHALQDSVYGIAKRQAGEVFSKWSKRSGAKYTEFIFPHLFGELARPFYNSAVSTICHQVAKGEPPTVNPDGVVELVHFSDAARRVIAAFESGQAGQFRVDGERLSIPELAAFVTQADHHYRQDMIIPDLRRLLHLRLFNTYRSYLFPDAYPFELTLKSDNRGALVETVKSENGGQTFLSWTKPGVTRGQHFHYDKVERFCVLKGKATIRVRRLFHDNTVTFDVCGDKPQVIDMPTLHTHNITNTGSDELVTLFWAHEIFDPDHPDTVAMDV